MAREYDELNGYCDNNFEEYNSDADIKLEDFVVQAGDLLDSKAGISLMSDHNEAQGVSLENIKVESLDKQLNKDVSSIENFEEYNSDTDIKLEDFVVQAGDFLDSKAGISLVRNHNVAQGVSLENIKVESLDKQLNKDVSSIENFEEYSSETNIKLEAGISLRSDPNITQGVLLKYKLGAGEISYKLDKNVFCPQCGKSFETMKLYYHIRSAHFRETYVCRYCGRKFRRKGGLAVHIRAHINGKPATCEICKKSFCEKGKLKKHMLTHTIKKPFACEICGKSFAQKGDLTTHIKRYTGEGPFTCKICGKSFAQKSELTTHIKRYTGEGPCTL